MEVGEAASHERVDILPVGPTGSLLISMSAVRYQNHLFNRDINLHIQNETTDK